MLALGRCYYVILCIQYVCVSYCEFEELLFAIGKVKNVVSVKEMLVLFILGCRRLSPKNWATVLAPSEAFISSHNEL